MVALMGGSYRRGPVYSIHSRLCPPLQNTQILTSPCYRGTSLIRKRLPVGPYGGTMPRVLEGPRGMGVFLWARYPCIQFILGSARAYSTHKF